jgi:hypothetical protein
MKLLLKIIIVFLCNLTPTLIVAQETDNVSPNPVDILLSEYDPKSVLIIGEYHGTKETPALVFELANKLSVEQAVTIGLEIPTQEQQRIDNFLLSNGDSHAKSEILKGPFWQKPTQSSDGRRSQAMLQLLDSIRNFKSKDIYIIALDDESFHKKNKDRRQGLAERIIKTAKNTEAFIVLMGNYHARVTPINSSVTSEGQKIEKPPLPTAARLGELSVTSVKVDSCDKGFWGCFKPGSCGPIQIPNQCSTDKKDEVFVLERLTDGYDLQLELKRLTTSPPVEVYKQ